MPTIIQVCAKVVSWYAQLFISACECADTILYLDQHMVALLMSSFSWSQHIFFCICQSVSIGCKNFWRIFFDVFFCDLATMDHIIPQPVHFVAWLIFFQDAFNYKHLFTIFSLKTFSWFSSAFFFYFWVFFFEIGFCWHCGAVLMAKGHCATSDRGNGFSRETWKTGWTCRLEGKSNS